MTGGPAPVQSDESAMRADPSKRRRYEQLLDSSFFTPVVEANRAYLAAALSSPEMTERDYSVLSCLPSGQLGRPFTGVSMRTMETFVLYLVEGQDAQDTPEVGGFVHVSRSVIEAEFGSLREFEQDYTNLEVQISNYDDAGDDQIRVTGFQHDLVAALWHERFAAAARELAGRVMQHRTMHARGHNYLLADHVLGRV